MDDDPLPPGYAARSHAAIDTTVPHSARIWNYWLGGKDNFEVDRAAGDAFASVYPEVFDQARESRKFLIRAVRHLVREVGIRQFLDIGSGLPTENNTHEVAQEADPACRIVYVDNDPLVLNHARALLSSTGDQGMSTYIDADLTDIGAVMAAAGQVLDLDRPVAVMFMGVLGHVPTVEQIQAITGGAMAAVPPGSHLVHWDGTDTSQAQVRAIAAYAQTGAVPYNVRSPEQIATYYQGLEVLEPGVVTVSQWRQAGVPQVDAWGAVARKP